MPNIYDDQISKQNRMTVSLQMFYPIPPPHILSPFPPAKWLKTDTANLFEKGKAF